MYPGKQSAPGSCSEAGACQNSFVLFGIEFKMISLGLTLNYFAAAQSKPAAEGGSACNPRTTSQVRAYDKSLLQSLLGRHT